MKKLMLLAVLFCATALTGNFNAYAVNKPDGKIQKVGEKGFEVQKNTVSNFEFYSTNYGIFGLDVAQLKGGGFWPRGSENQYIFGSGIWFGAQKANPNAAGNKKYVELSYNPNSGRSWFVPGKIDDGDTVIPSLKDKYRMYYSTDFDKKFGTPSNPTDGPNWPLWIDDTLKRYQYGTFKHTYVLDETQRNNHSYPMGPLFVSDEDIVCSFKDTYLDQYEGGSAKRKLEGYPLRLQTDSKIYSWGSSEMKDVVIQSYSIENKSSDTLYDCWVGGVYDLDLTTKTIGYKGSANDRVRYFDEDPSLNIGVCWTDTTSGEGGKGFGYIGISLLETPAVDANKFIRNDKLIFAPQEQLSLATLRNWAIEIDKLADDDRYNYLSSKVKDGDNGAGDKRMMISAGPFNMRPGDVARIAFSYTFALPAKGGEADGTYEDLSGFQKPKFKGSDGKTLALESSLIGKLQYAKDKYYSAVSAIQEPVQPNNLPGISIYPNPAKSEITISANDIQPNDIIRIYSATGNLMIESPVTGRLNVSALQAGVYYLRIGARVQKFVKI